MHEAMLSQVTTIVTGACLIALVNHILSCLCVQFDQLPMSGSSHMQFKTSQYVQ